ncbi:hypothetical protein ABZ616_19540 [Streptomyces noursei]|uniref:hypothetical protein n=1 Tax=Streptomyces noursei TaxID=1971 RepID=UPI0033FAE24C
MKRKAGMMVAGLAATGLAILGTTPASAEPVRGFNIKNVETGKCLVFNGVGHPVTAAACNINVPQQRWANYNNGVISAAGSASMGPYLLAKKGGGGDVYVNVSGFPGWSDAWSVSSFHDREKAMYGNITAGCYLKMSGGGVVCTPGRNSQSWWMAVYG